MTAPLPDQLLEEEIRAMLRRRAQDVNPLPPSWRELAQRNGAVVISLRTGAPVATDADRRRRRPSRQWFRPVLAAAVALILAMVGAVLVQGSGPNHADSADGPEPIDVPAAGNTDFDPARATPLFPVTDDASPDIPRDAYLNDPTTAAEEYLRSVGLPVGQDWMIVDDATRQSSIVNEDQPPVQTALVPWSLHAEGLPGNPPLSQGTVFLRNPERGGRNTWLVVGVMTRDLRLTDVRRDGDHLTFTVDRTAETETFQPNPAAVSVDGEVIGEVGYLEARPISVTSPAGSVAVIRVEHIIDGAPWSITSTAVPPLPGAPAEPLDSVPVPTTVVGGRANAVAAQLQELAERIAVIEVRSAPEPTVAGAVVAPVAPVEPSDPVAAEREAVSRR